MKIKKVDFTGHFLNLKGEKLTHSFVDKNNNLQEKLFVEMYEYLGNSLANLKTKDDDKMRSLEFAKEIYTKKCIHLNKSDEDFLIKQIKLLDLSDLMYGDIIERINQKPAKEPKSTNKS